MTILSLFQRVRYVLTAALFVWLVTGAGFTMTVPRIDSVTHNAFGTLMPGDTITVTLRGESGGQATFDITNLATGVPMREVSPGIYQGSFAITRDRDIQFATVTGHLTLYGRESRLGAIRAVSVGSRVALISPALQLTPSPGFETASLRPQIGVAFQNTIQPSSVGLTVDGIDYSSQAATSNSVTWVPTYDLSPGEHHVVVWAVDNQGRQLRRAWNFYVGNPPYNNLIQSASITPRTVNMGETVTATLVGTPGGTATMTLENGQNIMMNEGPPGIYTGTYAVPAGLQGRYAYLNATLRTPDGRQQMVSDLDAVYVKKAVGVGMPISINGPFGGSQVSQTFNVRGTAQPNALVKARVWAPDSSGLWHEVVSDQVRADASGNFVLPVDTGSVPSGSGMTLIVQAQNDQGLQSDELRLGLNRQ